VNRSDVGGSFGLQTSDFGLVWEFSLAFWRIGKRYREFHRATQVVQVLARHGLGHFVERMHLPLPARWRPRPIPPESIKTSRTLAQRAASAAQELGPTFVKAAQFLSTRPDLMPPVYIEEFSRLQDHVEPFPTEIAKDLIEEELGGKISEFFKAFHDVPIASGSIAQVHWAETIDGHAAVVKVKRPGIARVVSSDMEVLKFLAGLLEEYIPESRTLRPKMLVDEFGRHLERELDFLHEAAATQEFHKAFADSDQFHGPEVIWELTTPSVLTLERVSGRRISEYAVEADADARRELASRLFDLYMIQFFKLGHFHGDPHPGNILIDERMRINIVDFGLTGRITDELQGAIGTAVLALDNHDINLLAAVLEDLGVFTETTDTSEVKSDIRGIVETYYGMPLGRIRLGTLFGQINSIAQRNSLFLPRDFVLMAKALATVGMLARELDPNFNSAEALGPYLRLVVKKKLSPEALGRSLAWMGFHGLHLLRDAPASMRRVVRKILTGGLSINFQHKGLEKLISDIDRSSNRLAFSIVVASLIVASSLIMTSGIGPLIAGVSIIGIAGYLLAALLGLWLIFAILRSGRL